MALPGRQKIATGLDLVRRAKGMDLKSGRSLNANPALDGQLMLALLGGEVRVRQDYRPVEKVEDHQNENSIHDTHSLYD